MPALIYSPTETGVQPAMTPANAQGANFTPAIGQQMEHLGNEGSRIAADINRIQWQQKVASEKVQLDSVMADGFRQFTKYSEDQKGQVGQDGAGYTDNIMKAYDDWSQKVLSQPTTPQVKGLAAAQVKTLGNHFMEKAMNWEAQAGSDYRTNTINQATETNALTAEQDPSLYQTLLQNQLDYLHGSMGVLHSPQRMMELENHIRRTMSEAASLGFCRQNPSTCTAILQGEHPLPPDSVQAKIVAEANAKGVDPSVALANAHLESGMKPGAANPSPGETSAGLFGQTDTSWAQYAGKGADRGDVDTQVRSGVAQIADNQRILRKELSRDPTPYEMRMAHWFGPGIAKPANDASDNTPFAQVLAKAGYSQKSIPTVLAHNGLSANSTIGDVRHVVQTDMDKAMTATAGYANAPSAEEGSSTDKMPPFLAALTPQGREAMLTHSQTLTRKDDTLQRTQVESRFQDASAAWERGESAKDPPSLAEWRSAFGPQLGLIKYQKQIEMQNAGANFAKLATASPAEQQQILSSTAGASDALGMKIHDSMQAAAQRVNAERAADPIGFDQAKGMKVSAPLDWSNPQMLTGMLAGRYAQAQQISQQFGTPYKPLSEAEAGKLSEFFNKATPEQTQQYLASFRSAAGAHVDDYRALLTQIAPNHPALAMAGLVADQNPAAAQLGIAGSRMLRPTDEKKESTLIMPKDELLRQAWHDGGADEAYGSAHQKDSDYAFQFAKAYYIASQPPKDRNDKAVDRDLWTKAMDAATGGIVEFGPNGSKVLPPYGMPASQFHDSVAQVWPSVMANAGLDAEKNPMDNYSLKSVGPSQYAVMTGTGFLPAGDGKSMITFDLLNPSNPQPQMTTPDEITTARHRKLQADVITKLRGLPSKL